MTRVFPNSRLEFLDLLGYDPDDVSKKIEDGCGVKVRPPTPPPGGDAAVNEVADGLNNLDTTADKEGAFDAIASQHQGRRGPLLSWGQSVYFLDSLQSEPSPFGLMLTLTWIFQPGDGSPCKFVKL